MKTAKITSQTNQTLKVALTLVLFLGLGFMGLNAQLGFSNARTQNMNAKQMANQNTIDLPGLGGMGEGVEARLEHYFLHPGQPVELNLDLEEDAEVIIIIHSIGQGIIAQERAPLEAGRHQMAFPVHNMSNDSHGEVVILAADGSFDETLHFMIGPDDGFLE